MVTRDSDLKSIILSRMNEELSPVIQTAHDFNDLGSRSAIDQALFQLFKSSSVNRVARGLYTRGNNAKALVNRQTLSAWDIIDAITRRKGVGVLVDPLTCAYGLGLAECAPKTTTVNIRARLKPLKFEDFEIVFRPITNKDAFWVGRPAMRVVQALTWIQQTTDLENRVDVKDVSSFVEHLTTEIVSDLLDNTQELNYRILPYAEIVRELKMSEYSQ